MEDHLTRMCEYKVLKKRRIRRVGNAGRERGSKREGGPVDREGGSPIRKIPIRKNMKQETEERVRNGIRFFKAMTEYDSITVKKYFPTFIGLVEQLLKEQEEKELKSINKIFSK